MRITVVTVTYNSAATVEETILSVLAQDHNDIEYIIVDGGSTDGTLGIIEKYADRISRVIVEKDDGLYDAMNKGIRAATGEVTGFLHSDDFYTANDVLSRYDECFSRSGCDAVYADLYYVDRADTSRIVRKWKSGTMKRNSFRFGWMPPHPTFFVRTSLLKERGFDTAFRTAADYELMLRLAVREKIKMCYLPRFTVKMRTGGQSNVSLGNRLRANLEDRKAWKVNGLRPGLLTLYLKPLRKIFQFL